MNFLEAEISKSERRVKKIEENPDPAKLSSNKLRYELEAEVRRSQLAAWQEGRPLAEADGSVRPLLKAMGFECLDLMRIADRLPAGEKYLLAAGEMGFSQDACDRTIMSIALCALGELPVPSLLVSSPATCDPMMMSLRAIAERFGGAYYHIDVPWEISEQSLAYMVNRLRGFIEFAEARFPGHKYDEDKLAELQEFDRKAEELAIASYPVRRRVPCPLAGRDAFRLPRAPSFYPNPEKALMCEEEVARELRERADRGIGAVKDEKLRFMWIAAAPILFDPFSYLEKQGVAVPVFFPGGMARASGLIPSYGDESEYGRKLFPLEEVARMLTRGSYAAKGNDWVSQVLFFCRDLSLDGIVNFLQSGCMATLGLAKPVEDAAQRELAIPTLQLQGRTMMSANTQADVENMLGEFIDICLASKETRG